GSAAAGPRRETEHDLRSGERAGQEGPRAFASDPGCAGPRRRIFTARADVSGDAIPHGAGRKGSEFAWSFANSKPFSEVGYPDVGFARRAGVGHGDKVFERATGARVENDLRNRPRSAKRQTGRSDRGG